MKRCVVTLKTHGNTLSRQEYMKKKKKTLISTPKLRILHRESEAKQRKLTASRRQENVLVQPGKRCRKGTLVVASVSNVGCCGRGGFVLALTACVAGGTLISLLSFVSRCLCRSAPLSPLPWISFLSRSLPSQQFSFFSLFIFLRRDPSQCNSVSVFEPSSFSPRFLTKNIPYFSFLLFAFLFRGQFLVILFFYELAKPCLP